MGVRLKLAHTLQPLFCGGYVVMSGEWRQVVVTFYKGVYCGESSAGDQKWQKISKSSGDDCNGKGDQELLGVRRKKKNRFVELTGERTKAIDNFAYSQREKFGSIGVR